MLQVSYISDLTSQQFVNITNTNIILTNLSSGVQYSIVVTAITETGERIDSETVTRRTCMLVDIILFYYIIAIIVSLSLYSECSIFSNPTETDYKLWRVDCKLHLYYLAML